MIKFGSAGAVSAWAQAAGASVQEKIMPPSMMTV
jgi:hypothetical protein